MPFIQTNNIRHFVFESFTNFPIQHAIFTRQGGVSPAPWASLNLGATVGDMVQNVFENRKRAFATIGCAEESVYDVWQVHSNEIICTSQPKSPHTPHRKADAILTDIAGITLFMRFADCVPILLYDPIHQVIGIVHAGWMGTTNKIVSEVVNVMHQHYSCRPADLIAGIGPSIAEHHYTIGDDVVGHVKDAFGQDSAGLLSYQNGEVKLDLWEANRLILRNAGVSHIEISGLCTMCHLEDWYSHRGENGKTGRFGVLFTLKT